MLTFNTPLSQSTLHRIANRSKKEVLLRLLTRRHCADRSPFLSKVFKERQSAARSRAQAANLVGIGFGVKETNGALTDELAVRVYVTEKLPNRKVSSKSRVPSFVNGITTDVIPIGELRFQSRPLSLGASIRHVRGEAGSIGCIVAKRGQDDDRFILSASHVLAPDAASRPGDPILEVPASSGGSPIATLSDFEHLKTGGPANRFDAAIAHITNKTDIELLIPVLGMPQAPVMDAVLFQSVRKFGAGTLDTIGVVTAISAEAEFTLLATKYVFSQVIEVTGCGGDFSAGADSGALVIDALSNRAVGLVIGGADNRTYVSPIDRVLARFNVEIVY